MPAASATGTAALAIDGATASMAPATAPTAAPAAAPVSTSAATSRTFFSVREEVLFLTIVLACFTAIFAFFTSGDERRLTAFVAFLTNPPDRPFELLRALLREAPRALDAFDFPFDREAAPVFREAERAVLLLPAFFAELLPRLAPRPDRELDFAVLELDLEVLAFFFAMAVVSPGLDGSLALVTRPLSISSLRAREARVSCMRRRISSTPLSC
jgi:hypothetical protein